VDPTASNSEVELASYEGGT